MATVEKSDAKAETVSVSDRSSADELEPRNSLENSNDECDRKTSTENLKARLVGADNNGENVKNKKENMKVKIAVSFLKRASLLFLGYIICYFNWSLTLPIVAICSIVWYENTKSKKGERIQKKIRASTLTKNEILEIVKDLPAWVNFPDREKAEWLNEIICQLWPSINCYIIKYCRGKIQTNIRKKFDSFKFEALDFGTMPPKIDGVKVYNKAVSKDSIIIDFEVFYDGDCDINFSMSGTQVGTIKDFQMGVEIRIVLKPLLFKVPFVGGMQIFFLNIPDIQFELEGISGIPGFSYLVRQKIEEKINKKLVFPNKITKLFTKSIEAAELKTIEAEGVLRVHVFEARDLEKKDVTGKSDPYVILNVGAQEHKTQVIKRDLNPQWDYYCEFIILDPVAQQLYFTLYDQDEFNRDEFLGSGFVEIFQAIKPGKTDQWFTLQNARRGKIHMRFSWLTLSSESTAMNAAAEETRLLKIENIHTALLTIYIDSAVNLPKVKSYRKPDPYMILTVGKNQTKSRTKKHTCDPTWEQGFYLLVRDPENDSLIVSIKDKHSDGNLDQMVYAIRELLDKPLLQISKQEIPLQQNPASKITISLQLRILRNDQFEWEDSDSDSGEDSPRTSKRSSIKIATEKNANEAKEELPKPSKNSAIEETIEKLNKSEVATSPKHRLSNVSTRLEKLGMIELSLSYSELRQKLLVTVHKVANLPLKHPSTIPDPYVKVRLSGPGNTSLKNRTRVIVDSCDPVFEDTFEYLLSLSELPLHKLIVTVKNKKFFNSSILGQVVVEFKKLKDLEDTVREWYELADEQVSD